MVSPLLVNPNRRILVIDDNSAIHGDFRKILGAPAAVDAELDAFEAKLFAGQESIWFDIETASQGDEGLRKVEQSLVDDRPYALAFIDVRMPPGWDGIETTRRIWEVDPHLQVVICTAYSDYSWEQMQEQVAPGDRMLILKKPFDAIEVQQLANTLTKKWDLAKESQMMLNNLDRLVQQRTAELKASEAAAIGLMEEAVRNGEREKKANANLQLETAARHKLEAHLLRAQRMESIGTLAGGIAHDLNNVLLPIMMSVDLIKLSVLDENQLSILTTIEGSSKRAADMVQQVLAFARGVEGERQKIVPQKVITEMGRFVQETFPKNIQFSAVVQEDLPAFTGDATQIHQVLLNLYVNARDAMPNGGRLAVTAKTMIVDEDFVHFGPNIHCGEYVVFQVTDTGTGISDEVRDKIFDPFFTTKELGKGTGLGLSTVMAIVKSHGGFMNVDSKPGTGTSFYAHFPVESATCTAAAS
ncbi:MAG: ATP-binding protein [Prosthecobacter sp.]|nr:ATP-binding protein [Prosthecobacter sp.]